jgi:hypothetical protein
MKTPSTEAKIYQLLGNKKGWVKYKDIVKKVKITARDMRELANQSKGHILGNNKGYCLTKYASLDERNHAIARMISQAKKMRYRAAEIKLVSKDIILGRTPE